MYNRPESILLQQIKTLAKTNKEESFIEIRKLIKENIKHLNLKKIDSDKLLRLPFRTTNGNPEMHSPLVLVWEELFQVAIPLMEVNKFKTKLKLKFNVSDFLKQKHCNSVENIEAYIEELYLLTNYLKNELNLHIGLFDLQLLKELKLLKVVRTTLLNSGFNTIWTNYDSKSLYLVEEKLHIDFKMPIKAESNFLYNQQERKLSLYASLDYLINEKIDNTVVELIRSCATSNIFLPNDLRQDKFFSLNKSMYHALYHITRIPESGLLSPFNPTETLQSCIKDSIGELDDVIFHSFVFTQTVMDYSEILSLQSSDPEEIADATAHPTTVPYFRYRDTFYYYSFNDSELYTSGTSEEIVKILLDDHYSKYRNISGLKL